MQRQTLQTQTIIQLITMANEHTRLNDIEFHKYMCEVEEWFLNGSPNGEGYWAMIQATINGFAVCALRILPKK